jgi:hypothetical protein
LRFEEDQVIGHNTRRVLFLFLVLFFFGQVTMVNTLKLEDRLEGATNFRAWKARVLLLLEENDLKEYVESVVTAPIDPHELTTHKKKEVKAKRVLLEYVKDHLIPHIVEKATAKEMYDALVGIYQNKNTDRMLHLKHQLQIVRMTYEDTIVSYIMKITQIRDQITTIGETVQDAELGECGFERSSRVLGTIRAGDLCTREVTRL